MGQRPTKKQRRDETQAKLAALRAEQARRERRTRLLIAGGAVVAVIVVVGLLVGIKLLGDGSNPQSAASGPAPGAVAAAVTGIPVATYNTIGAGSVSGLPKAISGAAALTADAKPRIVYVGAEYCPYCAAERWPMVAALSRFGTFANLGVTSSSASDGFPNTPSLSFHGATYRSDVVSFTGYETTTNQQQSDGSYPALDPLSTADQALFSTYDFPPYVDPSTKGAIPFIDLGGRYMLRGAGYSPAVLKGMTHQQVSSALADPSSKVARAVDGTANVISAAICRLTGNAPADVCSSPGVLAGAKKLPAAP